MKRVLVRNAPLTTCGRGGGCPSPLTAVGTAPPGFDGGGAGGLLTTRGGETQADQRPRQDPRTSHSFLLLDTGLRARLGQSEQSQRCGSWEGLVLPHRAQSGRVPVSSSRQLGAQGPGHLP